MILVAGSGNLDFVVRATSIPSPGETVLGRELDFFPGGKGANQAIACARAGGAATEMLIALGEDWLAAPIEASLSDAEVTIHKVLLPQRRTGAAFIVISDDSENAITVVPGANDGLTGADMPPLQRFSHLLLQLETPIEVVTEYARAAKAHSVCVILNAAPARELSHDLLAVVDVLIVNEVELRLVSRGSGSIADCMERIDVPCVVATLGARGCCARQGSNFVVQAGFSVASVDTTGAGDTFCGTFAAAISKTRDLGVALRYACAAGALACTEIGAQSGIPTVEEVEVFLQDHSLRSLSFDLSVKEYCGLGT